MLTFFALVGDTRLQGVHLSLHAAYNALALTWLVVVRDADDEDDGEKYPGRCGHAGSERHRREEPISGLRQFQLSDHVRRVTYSYLQRDT